jgi:hypothetical protein
MFMQQQEWQADEERAFTDDQARAEEQKNDYATEKAEIDTALNNFNGL